MCQLLPVFLATAELVVVYDTRVKYSHTYNATSHISHLTYFKISLHCIAVQIIMAYLLPSPLLHRMCMLRKWVHKGLNSVIEITVMVVFIIIKY